MYRNKACLLIAMYGFLEKKMKTGSGYFCAENLGFFPVK